MTERVVDGQPLLQGRYRLLEPIARGGMAEVWEAVDEVLARPVAVKVLHRHLAADEAFRERFRREAVAAARLAHSNVVGTFDTGEDDGLPFIVMELVRGRTLRAVLDDGALPPASALAITSQVADALTAAHAAGIVHRDVKPGNILLCDGMPLGAPGSVKVADFGIARAATETTQPGDLTQPGTLLGTTKYLSPEQVQGGDPDARSDVYSLGVVLYEALTGRAPFAADTAMATAMAHVHKEPIRPRQLRAGIPRSVEQVVVKAMAKGPEERYQSAADLAAALRSIDLGDDAVPLVARDPTPPRGSPEAFQRSERSWIVPAIVIVGTAVALIALAFVLRNAEVFDTRSGARSGTEARPIAVAGPLDVLDPVGGGEKNARLPNLVDGDEQTTWETSRYSSPDFGRLKDGLGVKIDLGQPATVRRLVATSPTTGWSAEVYVSNSAGRSLEQWGRPVQRLESIAGTATFDGFEAEGRYVLLWFTRLGDDNRIRVAEIALAG